MVTTPYGRARAALLTAIAVIAGLFVAPSPAHADSGLGTPPGVSSDDWAPAGLEGDKGAPPPAGSTSPARTARTAAAAAAAAAVAAVTAAGEPTKCPTGCYFYALGRQEVTNTGAYATGWIAKPAVSDGDHSLGEISVQSSLNGATRQIVEVGWSVDPALFGDEEPHLFVYHWVNGVPGCYNGCGFVVAADATVKPGATLTPGTVKKFGIQYSRGNWWVSYDDVWFGYFPGTLWSSKDVTFTSAGAYQAFGEVASPIDQPCSDMGTGTSATASGTRAYWSGANYFDASSATTASKLFSTTSPEVDFYTVSAVGTRALFFGGPGYC